MSRICGASDFPEVSAATAEIRDWFALIDFLESEWSILELLTIPLSGQFFSLQRQVHPRP